MDIKKIIREEFELFNNELGIETPFSWLVNNFGNLTPVIKDGKVYYVDSERKPLFYHIQDEENGIIYINYYRIWSKLRVNFSLNYGEIQDIIKEWLGEAYNLRGFTPFSHLKHFFLCWERPII